jgi:hypothetical protein
MPWSDDEFLIVGAVLLVGLVGIGLMLLMTWADRPRKKNGPKVK